MVYAIVYLAYFSFYFLILALMLRNLLILLCLCAITPVIAQKKATPVNVQVGIRVPSKKTNSHTYYKQIGSPMPPIRVVTMEGKAITNHAVASNSNLVVMLFNPTCEHCQDQTELFEKNIFLFKKSKLLMIAAPSMGPYLQNFITNYHTDKYPGTIMVGLDSAGTIDNTFLYESLPQINIYNPERKLIKIFTGNKSIDSLKEYIQ